MADDLVAFIRARLDETQAVAEAVARDEESDWSPGDEYLSDSVIAAECGASVVVGPYGYLSWEVRRHIADHDPARVLRGVEADQYLVDAWVEWNRPDVSLAHRLIAPSILVVLEQLLMRAAAKWSTHADYQVGWAP